MEFRDFTDLHSWKQLEKLARKPYDLTIPAALNQERIEKYTSSVAGLDFLYATQRLDDQVLDALQQLADEAEVVDKFIAMKNGKVLNRIEGYPSENRQVLHTACRDIFSKIGRAHG